jgi:hypothetical protein
VLLGIQLDTTIKTAKPVPPITISPNPALNAVEPVRKISVHDSSSRSIWLRSLKLVRDPDKIGHFPKPRLDPCRHRWRHPHSLSPLGPLGISTARRKVSPEELKPGARLGTVEFVIRECR